ncbi:hypothetical protein ONR75_07755 [Rhodopseudomonas sp. P2A-2r]|uniref:hypothetical protein n=1 Tax=Rhodopseudomonas sp. P2A-2r TaxID=2991972 RepID=UPI0022342A66|nr:hypothetical protein [Rhodopseudomonas sp. P2A-2r]UZE52420.1 hypothetical protein ONR75_07755 [Rhodopseudomonas sp. P2A-2r]
MRTKAIIEQVFLKCRGDDAQDLPFAGKDLPEPRRIANVRGIRPLHFEDISAIWHPAVAAGQPF